MRAHPLPTLEWKHYAAPIARRVTGKEAHFRCMNQRLSYVPLQELIDRIAARVSARDISKAIAMEGAVGPVAGFRMHYTLVKSGSSVIEQLGDPFAGRIEL